LKPIGKLGPGIVVGRNGKFQRFKVLNGLISGKPYCSVSKFRLRVISHRSMFSRVFEGIYSQGKSVSYFDTK
jgi:hypothetical protein